MLAIGMLFFLFVISFLIGSIPWGVIISRLFYHEDIRKAGSGNIGATNALRTLGKRGGGAVFVLDFLKGVAASALGFFLWGYLLTNQLFYETVEFCTFLYGGLGTAQTEIAKGSVSVICASVAFLGCVWGHIFSPWLKFKGGKGVAVGVGAEILTLGVIATLIEIIVFLVATAWSKYVSLGSVLAAIACPFIALWALWGQWLAFVLVTIAAITVLWAHSANIDRLINGTESKLSVGKSKKKALDDKDSDSDVKDADASSSSDSAVAAK